jgi:hypothetical protein
VTTHPDMTDLAKQALDSDAPACVPVPNPWDDPAYRAWWDSLTDAHRDRYRDGQIAT